MSEISLTRFGLHKLHDVTLFLAGVVFAMLIVILLDYTYATPLL